MPNSQCPNNKTQVRRGHRQTMSSPFLRFQTAIIEIDDIFESIPINVHASISRLFLTSCGVHKASLISDNLIR